MCYRPFVLACEGTKEKRKGKEANFHASKVSYLTYSCKYTSSEDWLESPSEFCAPEFELRGSKVVWDWIRIVVVQICEEIWLGPRIPASRMSSRLHIFPQHQQTEDTDYFEADPFPFAFCYIYLSPLDSPSSLLLYIKMPTLLYFELQTMPLNLLPNHLTALVLLFDFVSSAILGTSDFTLHLPQKLANHGVETRGSQDLSWIKPLEGINEKMVYVGSREE